MKTSTHVWKSAAFLFLTLGARPALADVGYAYAWITDGSTANVSQGYSLNPGGAPVTATRSSAGNYTVTFPGSGIGPGWAVQATAYGGNSNYCNVSGWGGSLATVLCFNAAGGAADSSFTVLAVATTNDKDISFAWGDQPSTPSYTPSTSYSHNTSGGAISISRSSAGAYSVIFNGLSGAGGTVQVNTYSGNATCYSGGWGGSFLANVDCVNPAGAAVDAYFVIFIVPAGVSPTGLAFTWASEDGVPSYAPSSTYTYNPNGATNIVRNSAGQYIVTFSGLAAANVIGGNVRATSYVSTARCKVSGWSPGAGGSLQVGVGCYNSSGTAVDADYEVLALPPMGYAYAWIDTASGNVSATYTVNPGNAPVTATHNSTGSYTVIFPNSGIGVGWVAQANAYGSGANQCKVGSWGNSIVNVLCFNAAGAAVDTLFTVQAVSNTNANNIAFAWANSSSSASYTPDVDYSYNPAGPITITRNSTGSYDVTFTGLNGNGGTVQITAYGGGNVVCSSDGWGGTNFDASVICQNPNGTAADSDFSIYVIPAGASPSLIGYAWADLSTTATYTPDATYSYNPRGAISATRSGTGSYTMTFTGLNNTQVVGGDVRATAYATTARCKIGSWSSGTANITANVQCYNTSGNLVDAEYQVLVFDPIVGTPSVVSANAGSPQSAIVGNTFATALQAMVTDVSGNPIPGVTVTFTAPTSGASGTFPSAASTATASTNSSGLATAPAFTANGATGTYTVTATALGVAGAANFALTNTGNPSCTFTLGPSSASLPPTGTSTVEVCPNGSGQPSCGVLPEVPRSFTVTPSASCGAWNATSSSPGLLNVTGGGSGSGPGTVSYTLLTNTHTTTQNYSIAISSATGLANFTITETGNGDNEVYRQVYALYEQLLGRDPDAAGFAFWTGSGGAALGQMADSFLTSPEAFNIDFVAMAVFQAATGAPPSFAQYSAAVAALRGGSISVPGLFNSLIGGGYNANTLYANLLNRLPSTQEANNANANLANAFASLIGFPNSNTPVQTPNNEFQSTGIFHGSLSSDHSNGLYTQMLYYVILGRDPDAAGLAFWTGIANSGGPGVLFEGSAGFNARIQILGPGAPNQGFIGSPEFQGLFAN